MSNWKTSEKTNKKWKPLINQLYEAVYNTIDRFESLPFFEKVNDEGVSKIKGIGDARTLKVVCNSIEYHLALHFYNRHNGNCLAVKNLEDGNNLIQLVLDKFLKQTPKGIQIWHDGIITGVAKLNAKTLIEYINQYQSELLRIENGNTYIELGVIDNKEPLTFNQPDFSKFIGSLLRFAVMRQEIKKTYRNENYEPQNTLNKTTMNIFFGKISKTKNPRQFAEGFYETNYPEMFNGIDVGDYSYIIADNKIQLWKANSWSEDKLKLNFDIIIPDLNINTKDLTALKFLGLTKQFIVLTVRQSTNAFYRLNLIKDITESQLTNVSTYTDVNNYRKILIQDNKTNINPDSEDIQLYYENRKLNIYRPSFFSSDIFNPFFDNINKIGSGRKNKDKTLSLIKAVSKYPHSFTSRELSILNLYDASSVKYEEAETISSPQNDNNMQTPLNQILYGPPGTGKTYNTINKAISIIEAKSEEELLKENREEIKKRFDNYIENGQIKFTTFHQSMSYEDFIEGIKPEEPKQEGQPINYKIIDGIFKRACAIASYNSYKLFNKSKTQLTKYSFDDLYDDYIDSVKESIKAGNFPIYKSLTGKDVEVKEINSNDSVIARAKNSIARKSAPLTKENLQKLYDKFIKIEDIKDLKQVKDTVQITPRITEFYAVFRGLKDFEKSYNPDEQLIKETNDVEILDFDEIQKKFNSGVYYESAKTYGILAEATVLIIDEINRGNVSHIFGELITLIEDDKRIGKKESLIVELPYSKEPFGVPANLYIIGTMNTADRSVEAIDTALRRRFKFEEIMPDPNLIKTFGDLKDVDGMLEDLDLAKILTVINERIEVLLNRDHLIGHSYFFRVSDEGGLKETFYKNIIPLLQEYFYGDYGKIGLVLGSGFVREKFNDEKNKIRFANFKYDDSDALQKTVYEIVPAAEINIMEALQLLLNPKTQSN